VVASAFIDGDVTMRSLSQERIADPHVSQLRSRVQMRIDKDYAPGFLTSPIEVRLKLKSGKVSSVEMRTIHGFPPHYLAREEVVAKFERTTQGMISPERMAQIEGCVDGLEEIDDLAELSKLLRQEPISPSPVVKV
jgi:2-methylcitrate dehydratase PrpD